MLKFGLKFTFRDQHAISLEPEPELPQVNMHANNYTFHAQTA